MLVRAALETPLPPDKQRYFCGYAVCFAFSVIACRIGQKLTARLNHDFAQVSRNERAIFDISETVEVLGYTPVDGAQTET